MINYKEKIFIEIKNQQMLNKINLILSAYSFIFLCDNINSFPQILYTVYISDVKYITCISYSENVKIQLLKMDYKEKQLEEILLL